MTTVVVVRKGREIAIAADSLVTFGETRLSSTYEVNRKIIRVGDSYLGLAGSTAHFVVLERALTSLGDECRLGSRDEVFTTFQRIHPILKEKFYLNPKEDDDDPYESSQITCVIANASGIYGVYSYREVFAFERFWGIGSGRSFALGAMYASYDKLKSAEKIARAGIEAGIEFDKSSAGPIQLFSISAQA
ncbi:MAG TPA: MFS transporter [Burkholderiaceae bacterium]|nr:MFS transporter [Burkholderiaceae bacterium]